MLKKNLKIMDKRLAYKIFQLGIAQFYAQKISFALGLNSRTVSSHYLLEHVKEAASLADSDYYWATEELFMADNIQHNVDIRRYRGLRLQHHLPCRGQNTKTNAKTAGRMRYFVEVSNEST